MFFNTILTHWPVIYLEYDSSVEITDNDFDEYKKKYMEILVRCKAEKTQVYIICNIGNASELPMKYVMKQQKLNEELFDYNKLYIKCVCVLVSSMIMKNILKLYFCCSKVASPYKITQSYEKINKYLIQKMNYTFDISVFDSSIVNYTNIEEEE